MGLGKRHGIGLIGAGSRVRRLLAVGALALVSGVPAPAGAGAAPLPSASAYVTNGTVRAVAIDGSGRTYLGGDFTEVGPRTGRGIKLTTANDQPASGFPDVNGDVNAVVSDGSGGWFIGGDFTAVGGVTRNRLAHIYGDGTLDPLWNPGANGQVSALARSGPALFVGGEFSGANSIGGQSRNRIAKLSTTGTGAADATWNPGATGPVAALVVSGTNLFVGGEFNGANSIGGQSRNFIAKLATTGGGAADPTWNPNANSGVAALAVSGTDLFVGGAFFSIGGQSRNNIAKLATTGTGAADATWNPSANGGVYALALSGADLYAGGTFSGPNSIGGQSRNRIAKLATTGSGAADATWDPNANDLVSTLALSGTNLFVGGSFSSIGGQSRGSIAKLATTGAGTADAAWDPNPNSSVSVLAVSGTNVYAGGQFTSAGSKNAPRSRIARLNADGTLDTTWDPNASDSVYALAVSATDVYAGGYFNGTNSIGGQTRNYIAKIPMAGTGAADSTWAPNANAGVFALIVSGTDLYAGGAFSGGPNSIDSQSRDRIAKLSTTGGGAADATWNPAANNQVYTLALSGTDLYAGGAFNGTNSIGGQSRNYLAKLTTTTTGAADATWNPNPNLYVNALAVSGTDLFVGGDFGGSSSIGGQNLNGLAKVSTATGNADAFWAPNPNDSVLALAVSGTDLYVGGRFSSIGGQSRNHVAKLSTTGTGTVDPNWDLNADGAVQALAASGSLVAVGGEFEVMGPRSTQGIALLMPPPPAPSNTALPAITGTPTPGRTLSATKGTWTGNPELFTRQWRRCAATGGGCSDIPGATAPTYLVRAGDLGRTLRVVVTATNDGGSTQAKSKPTTRVAPPPPPVISNARFVPSAFKAKKGTKLKLTLSERATVNVVVTQKVKGRRVKGRCRRRAKQGKRCKLTVRKGKLSFLGRKGPNAFRFRLPKLKPGRYSATIKARGQGGRVSKPVNLKFRIKK